MSFSMRASSSTPMILSTKSRSILTSNITEGCANIKHEQVDRIAKQAIIPFIVSKF